MRRTLAVIAAFVGLSGSAAAAVPGPWEQHVSNLIALRYWHRLPPCGHPRVKVEDLGDGIDGEAASCTVVYNSRNDWLHMHAQLCEVTIHEWGHLVLGPAFGASNPSDPWHSADPRNIMNASIPDLPLCYGWWNAVTS